MEPQGLNFSFTHKNHKFYVVCTKNINDKNALDISVSYSISVGVYARLSPDLKTLQISKPDELLESSDPDDRWIYVNNVKGSYAEIRSTIKKHVIKVIDKLLEKKTNNIDAMPNKIKNLKSEDIKTDNANLYLIGDGEFYKLGEKLKTLREGDVCSEIVAKLKKHNYSYPHSIKTFEDLLNLLDDMDEEDKRKMNLQKDIIKVGTVKNTDEGQCPYCGSDDIDWGDLEVDTLSDQIYYKCSCNECGEYFSVWYKPVYIETVKD